MGGDGTHHHVQVQRDRCPYCHDPVAPSQDKLSCDGCMAWHHEECWLEHGSCSACGVERFAGDRSGEAERAGRGPDLCAWAGCELPVTSFEGNYAVRVGDRDFVDIKKVCTPHAVQQLQSFRLQTLCVGLLMAAFAVFVTVMLVRRGASDFEWLIPAFFVLGSAAGLSARRKYRREIVGLLQGENEPEAKHEGKGAEKPTP